MKNVLMVVLAVVFVANGAINKYWHVKTDGTGTRAQGTTWAQAINEDTLEYVLENTVAAGDVFFVLEGAYAFAALIDFTARDGTAAAPIKFIGVKAETTHEGADVVLSDWARDTTDFPRWVMSTPAYFYTGDYVIFQNFSVTSNGEYCYRSGASNVVENCNFHQNSGDAGGYYATNMGSNSSLINCSVKSDNRYGMITGSAVLVYNCKFIDIKQATYGIAIRCNGGGGVFVANKFIRCKYGIYYNTQTGCRGLGNTFFACSTAVFAAASDYGMVHMHNLLDSCKTDGFKWTNQIDGNFFMYNYGADARNNDMWDNVDVSTVFQDYWVVSGDPKFANAPDSLQLGSDSPALNAGMNPRP